MKKLFFVLWLLSFSFAAHSEWIKLGDIDTGTFSFEYDIDDKVHHDGAVILAWTRIRHRTAQPMQNDNKKLYMALLSQFSVDCRSGKFKVEKMIYRDADGALVDEIDNSSSLFKSPDPDSIIMIFHTSACRLANAKYPALPRNRNR